MKIRICLLAVLLSILCAAPAGAVSLEQVQPVMPQIDVFIRNDGTDLSALTREDVTADMDGVPLEVELLEPSGQGIFYVFLLDISRSISEKHLAAACEAVRSTYQQMGPEDLLALISFGNEVNILLRGGESAEQVDAALDTIHSTDDNTRFYDAMNTLIETASAKSDLRRVAVVVSDGVDDTDAGMSREELVDILRQSGVAVYAMAVDSAAEETREQFRDFIQESGGDLVTFSPKNAGETLQTLQSAIDEIWHLRLRAGNNEADGQVHQLSLRFGQEPPLEVDIRPTQWIPDEKPPYLISTELLPGVITVSFSEVMANLEDPACYLLRDSAGNAADFTVTAAGNRAELHCADLTDGAGWMLELQNLTDASMERNAMAACSVPLAPAKAEEPVPEAALPTEETDYEFLLLIGGGAAVVLLLLLLLVIRARRRKKPAYVPKRQKKRGRQRSGVTFYFAEEESSRR